MSSIQHAEAWNRYLQVNKKPLSDNWFRSKSGAESFIVSVY